MTHSDQVDITSDEAIIQRSHLAHLNTRLPNDEAVK